MPLVLKVILGVLTVALIVILAYYLVRFLHYRDGSLANRQVRSALNKFGIIRNYKVLSDLHLAVNGRSAHIDHMLIGFFGILFISTVNDTAEYYGTAKDQDWTKVAGEKREKMPNLYETNIQNIDVVREIFAKNNIFNIKMEGIVVFCGNPKKGLIGITGAQGLMDFKGFKAYLAKSKFEKDNDVDVPELQSVLLRYQVS